MRVLLTVIIVALALVTCSLAAKSATTPPPVTAKQNATHGTNATNATNATIATTHRPKAANFEQLSVIAAFASLIAGLLVKG